MSQKRFNNDLLDFLNSSPTAFHAVASLSQMLEAAGFARLHEGERWQLEANQGYYVTRNDSSIIAFRHNAESMLEQGIRLTGAHTDSPCLKLNLTPRFAARATCNLVLRSMVVRCLHLGLIETFPWPVGLTTKPNKVNYAPV